VQAWPQMAPWLCAVAVCTPVSRSSSFALRPSLPPSLLPSLPPSLPRHAYSASNDLRGGPFDATFPSRPSSAFCPAGPSLAPSLPALPSFFSSHTFRPFHSPPFPSSQSVESVGLKSLTILPPFPPPSLSTWIPPCSLLSGLSRSTRIASLLRYRGGREGERGGREGKGEGDRKGGEGKSTTPVMFRHIEKASGSY